MSKNTTLKRSVEAVSGDHSLSAPPVNCEDTSLAADEDSERIIYVKTVRVPRENAAAVGLCLSPGTDTDHMSGPQQSNKKRKPNPTDPGVASLLWSTMPHTEEVMDFSSTSRPSSPQPLPQSQPHVQVQPPAQPQSQPQTQAPSRCCVHFPDGHGKTLAQLYEWFMALLKQHPTLEPVIKEGRRQPYLTVNSQADAYSMLVEEGILGFVMVPADLNARHQVVIIHGVSTSINVNLIATPVDFVWLKRHVVGNMPRPQLLGLVEGAVPSSVHLLGLGRFQVEPYTAEPDLCRHCCRFGHQEWKCKSAPRCRYCAGNHQSFHCLENI